MTNGFVHTVKSKTDSLPLRAYFKNEDIGHALDTANYNSARGWLTNKQGRQIEITLDDNIELERILAEGLDFDHLHLHVEFEELESTRITITAGNVPVEAGDMLISEVIEAHGGRIERVAYVTQDYRGNQVQTGRRRYYTTKTKEFQPLPKVVRLFGGRYISFRHPGQPVTEDSWGANEIPSARNNRSYASVLSEQPPSQPDHTAYQDTEGETNKHTSPRDQADPAHPPDTSVPPSEPSPQSSPAQLPPTTQPPPLAQPPPTTEPDPPAQPPTQAQSQEPPQSLELSAAIQQPTNDGIHQYLQFTTEAAMDWEETTTTPLPAHIERFTIAYFEWLQANTRPSDPRIQAQFISIWQSCITKVNHINSAPHHPEQNQSPSPSTPQFDHHIPATRQSINARSMQIMLQSTPTPVQSTAIESSDIVCVPNPIQEGNNPTEEAEPAEPEKATRQHIDSWGDTDLEAKQDMEWDSGALEGPRIRPMEAITVIDSDDSEGQPDTICQREEGELPSDDTTDDKLAIPVGSSPLVPDRQELEQPEVPSTVMTTNDLLPDYANQESSSQSVALGPDITKSKPKKKKKRFKPGTDSEAGVVPPGAKKPNKPDGFHVKVGNFERRITNGEAKRLEEKINGKTLLTHEDILMDTLLHHGRLNNMLNHQNTTSESRAKMFSYYGYLYYRHIGPMSTEWSDNPYIDHTPDGVLNKWDEFSSQNIKYNAKLYEDYLPMLNLSRRSGKS